MIMRCLFFLVSGLLVVLWTDATASTTPTNDDHEDTDYQKRSSSASNSVQQQIVHAKLNLWSRGAYAFDTTDDDDDEALVLKSLEAQVQLAPLRLGPIRQARRDTLLQQHKQQQQPLWNQVRGGGSSGGEKEEERIQTLSTRFGPDFVAAIERNRQEHAADCQASCEFFYCATPETPLKSLEDLLHSSDSETTTIKSYSFGPVPPEDFAETFGFPLDLIKVTEGKPLFDATEAAQVIKTAEQEGVDQNEYTSGKYKLGGDWLTNLPQTRQWFNTQLEHVLFPLLAHLFPEIISSQSTLRAHSVSLLKYNASHPRTDVHIDNGILALTLALTPRSDYNGGGTFFEHFGADQILEMDVGHATLRPGSVRHGGHAVTSGTRYVLGGFLLLEDKVEHVRRLKNRGTALRHNHQLEEAKHHFEWALALNPKCTTCLKDWAEILLAQQQFAAAEEKIRTALDLLENQDSDALFTLGILLSEQGRDDESIEAYQQSVQLNAQDAELCYNLGIKLGAKGHGEAEMEMYARAVQVDPTFGGAWLNWGTVLAERGELDEAEPKFLQATQCGGEVAPKGMINLGLLYHAKSNTLAQGKW